MRQKLALGAMLGGSAAFLVSLYLPWISAAFCPGPICVLSDNSSVATDGWNGFGQIAAVLALALAAGAIAAAVKQERASRLPLGRLAIALGIFSPLAVSALWTSDVVFGAGYEKIRLGPGAYIGLAGAAVACAGAGIARWGELARPHRATAAAGTLITLALIASFVLTALNAGRHSANLLTGLPVNVCLFACLGLLAWHGERPEPRLATAAATATLVAACLLPLRHDSAHWPYELWLLAGCAAALLVLGLVVNAGLRIRRPNLSELATVVGSALLLVSLFLPWQSLSYGSHQSQPGWSTAELAGVFALGLLLALAWRGRYARELAIGAAVDVLAAGVTTAITSIPEFLPHRKVPPITLRFEYGAVLGFVGVALLLVVAVGRVRAIPDKRFLVRLVPVLAALTLLTFAITPTLLNIDDLLGETKLFALQSPFVSLAFLAGMVILLTLRLVRRWVDSAGDRAEIVLVPFALLALTALAVIHDAVVSTTLPVFNFTYGKGVSWEGWVAVFLCVFLAACGWIARKGFYRRARTEGSASTTSLATSP